MASGDVIPETEIPGGAPLAAAPSQKGRIIPEGEISGAQEPGYGQAVQAGLVSGVPFGRDIAAAAETGESYLPSWMRAPGDVPTEQTGQPISQRFAENRARIAGNISAAQKNYPITTTAASLAPAVLAPVSAASLPRAMAFGAGYGALYGAGEGDTLEDRANRALWGGGLGAAGGAGGYGLGKLAGAILPGQTAEREALTDAANRLDVQLPLYAASSSPAVQRIGMLSKSIPFVGEKTIEASRAAAEQLGEAGERAAGTLGTGDVQQAGERMKGALTNWIGPTSKARVGAAYNYAGTFINPKLQTPLTATQQAAATIASERASARLNGVGGAVSHVADAIGDPNGLTYDGIKKLRTTVGEMIDGDTIMPADTSQSDLKRIYGGLSSDLERSVVNSGSQQGLQAFQRANQLNKDVWDNRQKLATLIGGGKATAAPGDVYRNLARAAQEPQAGGNIDLLRRAKNAVPQNDWDEMASGMVAHLGRDPATDVFSGDRFLTGYGKLSDAAKDELFGSQGGQGVRRSLDDIQTVSQRLKKLNVYANPSGTSHFTGAAATAAGAIELAPEIYHHPWIGVPAVFGGYLASRALSMPVTARANATLGKAWAAVATNPVSQAARAGLSQAATKLSGAMAAQFGARAPPADILNAIGEPQRGQ